MSAADYELAVKVAAGLGGGWQASPGEYGPVITGDGDVRLHLEADWRKPGRVEVSGVYPSTRRERLDRAGISVRADRGPMVIASEITRRLLPGYLAELGRVREFNAREAAGAGLREALAGKVTGMFPGSFTRATGYTGHGTEVVIPGGRGPGGTVDLDAGAASVTLTLRAVPAAVALRMLAALAEG